MRLASILSALGMFALLAVAHAQDAPKEPQAQPTKPTSTSAGTKPGARPDRLDLDTTVVTGNRELPKVLYIVPWKKAEIGDLPAQPFNTLLDEVLTPVDREVFKREVQYFQTVNEHAGEQATAGAQNSSAPISPGAR